MVRLICKTGIRAGDEMDYAPPAAIAALRNGMAEAIAGEDLPPAIREALRQPTPDLTDTQPKPQAAAANGGSATPKKRKR